MSWELLFWGLGIWLFVCFVLMLFNHGAHRDDAGDDRY